MAVIWKLAAQTALGTPTGLNGDAHQIYPLPHGTLLVIADTVGQPDRESAAAYSVRRVDELWTALHPELPLRERLRLIVLQINEELYQQNYTAMGNTLHRLAALLIVVLEAEVVTCAWVGHCQAYVVNKQRQQALQITRDHTQGADLVRRGQLSPAEYQRHPLRGALLRVLGAAPYVEVDTEAGQLEAGDCLVICTDGLTRYVTNADLVVVLLPRGTTAVKAQRLIKMAQQRGDEEDMTILIAEPALPTAPHRIAVVVVALLILSSLVVGWLTMTLNRPATNTPSPTVELDRTAEATPEVRLTIINTPTAIRRTPTSAAARLTATARGQATSTIRATGTPRP